MGELGVVPSKAMGQSFLVDRNVLGMLVRTVDPRVDDAVLEVGPGLGVVTEQLLATCGKVVAVEKDERLHDYLAARFEDEAKLDLRHADMLDRDAAELMGQSWSESVRHRRGDKFVSNLPYSVGTRILVDLTKSPAPPSRVVVTVQEEVGRRLTAREGGGDYGALSIWAGIVYEVELVKVVSPNCFWPRPEVRSAIVRMDRRGEPLLDPGGRKRLHEVTRQAFGQRRKQLATTLGAAGSGVGLDPGGVRELLVSVGAPADARPQAVSIEQWCRFICTLEGVLPKSRKRCRRDASASSA